MQIADPSSGKTELIQAAKLLASSGLLFRGEHANLFARSCEDKVVITRGGSIANLSEDGFAVVTLQGDSYRT